MLSLLGLSGLDQNGPPHHCQEKVVREADSVTEGNCENVQQHQQQKSSGILDRVARDLD